MGIRTKKSTLLEDEGSDAWTDCYTDHGQDAFKEALNDPLQASQPSLVDHALDIPSIFPTGYEVLQLRAVSKSVPQAIQAYLGSIRLTTTQRGRER